MRHHPILVGLAAGAVIGTAAGLATKGVHCPPVYDGKPYNGTSPGCPK